MTYIFQIMRHHTVRVEMNVVKDLIVCREVVVVVVVVVVTSKRFEEEKDTLRTSVV